MKTQQAFFHPSIAVKEKREPAFFPSIAQSPVFGEEEFSYENERGAKVVALEIVAEGFSAKESFAYYRGGATFANASLFPEVKVLANYKGFENPMPAIVQCSYGKGIAILSGVHPEYSARHLYSHDPFLCSLLPKLKEIEEERKNLFRDILNRLLT